MLNKGIPRSTLALLKQEPGQGPTIQLLTSSRVIHLHPEVWESLGGRGEEEDGEGGDTHLPSVLGWGITVSHLESDVLT